MDTHRNDIRALTGLRGVAALWVVIYHITLFDRFAWPFDHLLVHGYLAVDMFFILSGFVMALSYRRMFEARVLGRNYLVFMIRRIARVYPLYLAMTLFIAALNIVHLSRSWTPGAIDFLTNLLMVQGWGLGTSIDFPAWSVSAELGAYLLFPLFALATLRGRARLAVSAVVLAAGIVALSLMDFGTRERHGPLDIYWFYTPYPLMRCLCEFGLGLVTFRLAGMEGVRRAAGRPMLAVLLAAAIVALLTASGTDILVVALVPFLILALSVAPRSPVSRFLSWQPVFLLGEISYAVYLLHFEFVRVRALGTPFLVRHHLPPLAADIIATGTLLSSLLVASYLAFRYLEVPARKAIRRLEDRLQPDASRSVLASEAAGRHEIDPALS